MGKPQLASTENDLFDKLAVRHITTEEMKKTHYNGGNEGEETS